MTYRIVGWTLLLVTILVGAWVLDRNNNVQGGVSPDFCTDCNQFEHYLEDVGG